MEINTYVMKIYNIFKFLQYDCRIQIYCTLQLIIIINNKIASTQNKFIQFI